jgi:ABC-type nitrate/sulfonate/bicarbonate transport system substrate-binding protein
MDLRHRWLGVLLAVFIAGCSNTPAAQSGGTATTGASTREALTYAGNPDLTNIVFWYTYYSGGFAKQNLDLTISSGAGAAVAAQVVGGQADIGAPGVALAMGPPRDGKETSVIYSFAGNGIGAFVYGVPGVNSVKDCKKAGAVNSPGPAYGYASLLKEALGASYEIIRLDGTALPAALQSGQVDCAIGPLNLLGPVVTAGKAKILYDNRNVSQRPSAVESGLTEGVFFGMKDNLQKKQEAVVRFLKALNETWTTVLKPSNADAAALANFLKTKAPNDWPQTPESLTFQLQAFLGTFLVPNDGYIDAAKWNSTIAFNAKYSELGFLNTTDAVWSYARRVDMSFYEKAIGKPK